MFAMKSFSLSGRLCGFMILIAANAMAETDLQKKLLAEFQERARLANEFVDQPTLERFLKLDVSTKGSMLLFYNSGCGTNFCPQDFMPESKVKALRDVFTAAQSSIQAADLQQINQSMLTWSFMFKPKQDGGKVTINGVEYVNYEAAMDQIWKNATNNESKAMYKFICDYMVSFSSQPEGLDEMEAERLHSVFSKIEQRVKKMNGPVPDECVSEVLLPEGKRKVVFSRANVLNNYQQLLAQMRSEKLAKEKTDRLKVGTSDPKTFSSISHCQRNEVKGVVDQFSEYQNGHKSNSEYMVLMQEHFCRLTLRFSKDKKNNWFATDYLNRDQKNNPIKTPFADRSDLVEIIMSRQSPLPKFPEDPKAKIPRPEAATPASGNGKGGAIYNPFGTTGK